MTATRNGERDYRVITHRLQGTLPPAETVQGDCLSGDAPTFASVMADGFRSRSLHRLAGIAGLVAIAALMVIYAPACLEWVS